MKNKYFVRSRILEKNLENYQVFSTNLTATQIAFLSEISHPTIK